MCSKALVSMATSVLAMGSLSAACYSELHGTCSENKGLHAIGRGVGRVYTDISHRPQGLWQVLLFWPLKGGLNVSSATVSWYRSSYGTDLEIPYTISNILYTIYHLFYIK